MTIATCTTRPKIDLRNMTRMQRAEYVRENPGKRHRLRLIECGKCRRAMFLTARVASLCPGKLVFRPPTMQCRRFGVRLCPMCWVAERPTPEGKQSSQKIGKAGTYAAECRSGGF